MGESPNIRRVMVTGATGFVGWSVVRELLARGITPVCFVRSRARLLDQHPDVDPERFVTVTGNITDRDALRRAADLSDAVIHLVGIIITRRMKGQTFARIHTRGTQEVVEAARRAGLRRYVHISALGTGPNAVSAYHRTKWAAEEYVTRSTLDWTIFRPSLIHGPRGEFMRLMKHIICGRTVPIIPYFGSGRAKVQPVSDKDVAFCLVESLFRADTNGKVIPLGGSKVYTWVELYNMCRALMPGAKRWKPLVSMPVAVAKLMAVLSTPPMALGELVIPSIGMFRFDAGQVLMSQEDNVCDHTLAERTFGLSMRTFEDELTMYAERIG